MVELSEKYQQNEEEYEKEYLKTLAEYMQNFSDATESASIKLKEMEDALAEYQSKIDSAVAAAKRAEEMRTEKDFYRIQLSDIDLHEIEILKDIVSVLRDKESFNKVIWKCYYEKPTSDLIGRVIGSGTHTGIYKITHIDSERCYVGQAVNLADRWRQHIKRGLGADTPTKNKLYPAMNEHGPENFTFEVIEECDRSLLDEREDYWQEYFKAKEFGYSIK